MIDYDYLVMMFGTFWARKHQPIMYGMGERELRLTWTERKALVSDYREV